MAAGRNRSEYAGKGNRKERRLMAEKHYADLNAAAVDRWVAQGWEWGRPISHEDFLQARKGLWHVLLTPQIPVPPEWFPPCLARGRLDGSEILGLSCGGGQQMPVFAALGANVTVLDYSDRQLENEREVAQREGYFIRIVKADMTRPFPFESSRFDLSFHPVSNCYAEDVRHVWKECFRVLKKGGVLLAGMDNGFSYLFDGGGRSLTVKNKLPCNPLKNPELMRQSLEIDGSVQFSHSLEEQIGGQLKAGFILTDLLEDRDREGLLGEYFPQYILTRAVKP